MKNIIHKARNKRQQPNEERSKTIDKAKRKSRKNAQDKYEVT
jgi:hypothetical protein